MQDLFYVMDGFLALPTVTILHFKTLTQLNIVHTDSSSYFIVKVKWNKISSLINFDSTAQTLIAVPEKRD
jgi:hypothetical protein